MSFLFLSPQDREFFEIQRELLGALSRTINHGIANGTPVDPRVLEMRDKALDLTNYIFWPSSTKIRALNDLFKRNAIEGVVLELDVESINQLALIADKIDQYLVKNKNFRGVRSFAVVIYNALSQTFPRLFVKKTSLVMYYEAISTALYSALVYMGLGTATTALIGPILTAIFMTIITSGVLYAALQIPTIIEYCRAQYLSTSLPRAHAVYQNDLIQVLR